MTLAKDALKGPSTPQEPLLVTTKKARCNFIVNAHSYKSKGKKRFNTNLTKECNFPIRYNFAFWEKKFNVRHIKTYETRKKL